MTSSSPQHCNEQRDTSYGGAHSTSSGLVQPVQPVAQTQTPTDNDMFSSREYSTSHAIAADEGNGHQVRVMYCNPRSYLVVLIHMCTKEGNES